MAQLTADDVVLKGFQTTKFREGYDQVEVDDFLDEVAVSMRAMAAENDELKRQLAAAEARIAELERAAQSVPEIGPGPVPPPVAAPPPVLAPEPVAEPIAGPPPGFGLPGPAPAAPLAPPAPLPPAPPAPPAPIGGPITGQPVGEAPGGVASEAETATGMLALANKLHEQYVRAGQEEGDQMIAEAKTQAASIVREAEETAARTKARLEQERAELEKDIESLRIFERDYRTRLRTYLKNLLADVDGSSASGDQPL
ncbi:MAG: DivIVA domain-containing protein [Bifidobacteriaceae bacterium]|jgi:DivIVA domain-containing protein|nr:DivIVA domain-containing protein [Bifidobacteriaceae bacterium]